MTAGADPSVVLAGLRERIVAADRARAPLRIRGGGTKDFYGEPVAGEPLDTRPLAGIVSYEPTELVVTVRAGTPLVQLQTVLGEQRQMLAFEPPAFGPDATVGGVVASGLSGPRRQAAGAVRDFVLGAALMAASGELLYFGGQVMKNVAGYDVSRLLCGSLGILGLITELSLKVLPVPAHELSLRMPMPGGGLIAALNRWGGRPLPISATVWHDDVLTIRLSGARSAVEAAVRVFAEEAGAEPFAQAEAFWEAVREQRVPFFADVPVLWRLALPSTTPMLDLPGRQLIEWGGGLRWLASDAPAALIRERVSAHGGHATLFRADDGLRAGRVFTPLAPVNLQIHQRLKREFDPNGIFNAGRMYPNL